MMPLGFLTVGEKAVVIEIRANVSGKHKNLNCHIEDMGFRVGKIIQMLNNYGTGPVLIKLDESRIAVARGMAMKIWVKKLCEHYNDSNGINIKEA